MFPLDWSVTWLGWVLVAAIVLHHVFLIYVLPWDQASTIAFGEAQVIIFGGFAIILGITLWCMPTDRPIGYRWATSLLLVAQGLLLVAAVVRARGPDRGDTDTATTLLFIAIHLCSVWSLAPLVPWHTLPRAERLRLSAETALVMALCNLAFQLLMPVLITAWRPTPFVTLTQFRLVCGLGLMFLYAEAYRRFGRASRRVIYLAGSGLGWMVLNDAALLWAVVQVADGASGKLIRATGVIWMLQQWSLVMVMYWAMRQPVLWVTRQTQAKPAPCWRRVVSLQGVLLIGVVLVACVISPSWDTTLLIAGALLSRESVLRFEQGRAYEQAQDLAAALATMSERKRLARELHDRVQSTLSAVAMQQEACERWLERDLSRARDSLAKAHELTRQGLVEIRQAVNAMRPSDMQSSLAAILAELVEKRTTDVLALTLDVRGQERTLPVETTLALVALVGESITNIKRHAHAAHAVIQLDYTPLTHTMLRIKDDGHGVDNPKPSHGLTNMRDRIQALGGAFDYKTCVGEGFEITVEVPDGPYSSTAG